MNQDQKWIVGLCTLGSMLVLLGFTLAVMTPEFPWFAPIVAGIIAFTAGLTVKDAAENDQQQP